MNGSRSHTPAGGQFSGQRSSLDTLNRTIEGLEARIEGLMGGGAGRDQPRPRMAVDRDSGRLDPVSDIVERQRALSAARERVYPREERRPAAPNREFQPRETMYREPPRHDPLPHVLQSARPSDMRTSMLRPSDLRPSEMRPSDIRSADMRHAEKSAGEKQGAGTVAMADIAQALIGLRQELKKDISDGLQREMGTLHAEIRGIKADAETQDFAGDMRADLQRLADSIKQIGRQAPPAQADALRVEFDELRAMIDGLAREDSVRRMETRWTGVEDRMNAFDQSRDDELVALAYRLDDLKSQMGGLSNVPAIHALEDKLIALGQAVESLGTKVQPDDRRLTEQFGDLDARLDEISRAIVASGRTSASVDAAAVGRVESRLAEISRQIDSVSRPVDTGIGARVEALAARVEELANAEAAVRLEERLDHLSLVLERSQKSAQLDLTDYLSEISRKIEALDHGSVNDLLAERLDMLARRIDDIAIPAPAAVPVADHRFERLEFQLADIAQRLEETQSAPHDDSRILANLEAQISTLSTLISQPQPVAAPVALPVEFESRMHALEDYLSTSDEYIIEAARHAAEAVMEAYAKNGLSQSAAGGADLAAISALADDLRVLEDISRSSEERTHRTFEALHETLVQIAGKLERLEERSRPDAHDESPVARRETRPQMPKASARMDAAARDMPSAMPAGEHVVSAVAPVLEDRPHDQPAADSHSSLLETHPPRAEVAAKAGLLGSLTRRFTSRRPDEAQRPATSREATIEPTLQAANVLAPEEANQLLAPGSGAPDVKKILERVRAGQKVGGGQTRDGAEGDRSDFILAARRAAKQAAEEVDTNNRLPKGKTSPSAPGALARNRRPILMAVGAILLAVMSYPLVSTLIRNDVQPAAEPIAAIERPAEPAATATDDVRAADAAPGTNTPALATPSSAPEERPGASQNAGVPETGPAQTPAGETTILQPIGEDVPVADLPSGFSAPTDAPVAVEGFVPATEMAKGLAVPDSVGPAALVAAAKGGDPNAWFEIAARYTEGRGVKEDLTEAAKWYQRAADAGIAPAEYRLASLYEKGTGVARDPAKARALYEAAAAKGNASAMHNLAVMLATGGDSAPDFAGAGTWFKKAADLGVRDSQFNLAILHARGNGVAQDLEESYKWFAIAARDGDADAAQKRDEVAKAMTPAQLEAAKARFESWRAMNLDDKANAVPVPDTWVGTGTKTASVDMGKAVRNIQAILNNNGFDAGAPDGKLGEKTVSAIKAFQTSIGQTPNGEITDALVKELLKRNSAPAGGEAI